VHPDPDGAVRGRRRSGEPPCQSGIGTTRCVAGADARERCELRRAPEAIVAIERLGARDLRASPREEVRTQLPLAFRDPADREHGLDEVAPRVVPRLRAVGCVRVCGLSSWEIAVSRRAETAVRAVGDGRDGEGEQEREGSHAYVVPSGR